MIPHKINSDSYQANENAVNILNLELNLKKVYDVENRITETGLKNSSTKILPVGCILIGLAGQGKTRGTVAINMVELCTNQSIASIFPNKDIFDVNFLYYNLDNRYKEIRSMSTGDGGRGGLNLQIIKFISVNLPSLLEQKKIAEFLTVIDNKIYYLTKKKQLFEQYKKGLMQQIFSQKIRFKEDNGSDYPDWETKKLGIVIIKNSLKNRNSNINLVQSVSNKFGFVNQLDYFEDRVVASHDLNNYCVISQGVFAYNPSRIDVGSLAYKFDNTISVISPLLIMGHTVEKIFLIDSSVWTETDRALLTNLNESSDQLMLKQAPFYEQLPTPYRQRLLEMALVERNAIANYNAKQYSGKVILFKATQCSPMMDDQPMQSYNQVILRQFSAPYNGWDKYVKNLTCFHVNGDHASLMKGGSLSQIAKLIQESLT